MCEIRRADVRAVPMPPNDLGVKVALYEAGSNAKGAGLQHLLQHWNTDCSAFIEETVVFEEDVMLLAVLEEWVSLTRIRHGS